MLIHFLLHLLLMRIDLQLREFLLLRGIWTLSIYIG